MLRLIPTALVIPCSQMLQDEFENAGQPGEESTACSADDAVWFSPACRQNTTECVPVLLQGRLDRVALLAEHLSLPLAAVVVSQGSSRYAEYFAAVRAGRFLFAYRSPDDTLTDEAGRAPVPVRLPQAGELPDALQEVQGQMEGVMLRTYAWQGLAAADRRVAWFAAAVGVSAAGMARMMHQTAGLRREGGPDAAVWRAACDWVRANERRWRAWIPAACAAGTFAGNDLSWSESGPPPPPPFNHPLSLPHPHTLPARLRFLPCASARGLAAAHSASRAARDCGRTRRASPGLESTATEA